MRVPAHLLDERVTGLAVHCHATMTSVFARPAMYGSLESQEVIVEQCLHAVVWLVAGRVPTPRANDDAWHRACRVFRLSSVLPAFESVTDQARMTDVLRAWAAFTYEHHRIGSIDEYWFPNRVRDLILEALIRGIMEA